MYFANALTLSLSPKQASESLSPSFSSPNMMDIVPVLSPPSVSLLPGKLWYPSTVVRLPEISEGECPSRELLMMDGWLARAGFLGPRRLILGHLGGVVAGVVGDPQSARGPLSRTAPEVAGRMHASGSSSLLDKFGPQGRFLNRQRSHFCAVSPFQTRSRGMHCAGGIR